MKSHVFVDLETSGLSPDHGAVILSIGACVVTTRKQTPTEFSILIRPTIPQWAEANPKALEVNGLTYERLMAEGVPFNDAVDAFCGWAVRNGVTARTFEYVGQNPAFDLRFLQHFMSGQLAMIGFPLTDPIDIRDLYSILVNRRAVPYLKNRNGENISLALGVEPEPAIHDALEGARVVRRNYLKLIELGARK